MIEDEKEHEELKIIELQNSIIELKRKYAFYERIKVKFMTYNYLK